MSQVSGRAGSLVRPTHEIPLKAPGHLDPSEVRRVGRLSGMRTKKEVMKGLARLFVMQVCRAQRRRVEVPVGCCHRGSVDTKGITVGNSD